jgi:type IV pilus assembly protein PilC
MTTVADEPQVDAQPQLTKRSPIQSILQFELTPKKVPPRELMQFSRQLAAFLRAGIPILEALETIQAEVSSKLLRKILVDVIDRVTTGSTLGDAFAPYNRSLPPYYLGILQSAELTGNLDRSLIRLSDYIERDVEARRRVTSALTYPAIVSMLSIGVVVVLVVYVLPKFVTFFKSFNAKLPLPTRMLLSFASGMHTLWFIPIGILVLLVLLGLWLTQVERGRATRDAAILRVPVVGSLVRMAALERFCRVLHSMIVTGVPMPEALAVTADAVSNRRFASAIMEARDRTLRGEGLAQPLADTGMFPAAARQMLRVGEASGSLDEQLAIASEYYDGELNHELKRFTSLFEPIVIMGVGAVVGFVAIALVSAMYGIYHQVHV